MFKRDKSLLEQLVGRGAGRGTVPEYHRERPAEIGTEPEYRECHDEIGTVGNYAIYERRLVIQEGLVISSLACSNFPLLCNLQLIVYKLHSLRRAIHIAFLMAKQE